MVCLPAIVRLNCKIYVFRRKRSLIFAEAPPLIEKATATSVDLTVVMSLSFPSTAAFFCPISKTLSHPVVQQLLSARSFVFFRSVLWCCRLGVLERFKLSDLHGFVSTCGYYTSCLYITSFLSFRFPIRGGREGLDRQDSVRSLFFFETEVFFYNALFFCFLKDLGNSAGFLLKWGTFLKQISPWDNVISLVTGGFEVYDFLLYGKLKSLVWCHSELLHVSSPRQHGIGWRAVMGMEVLRQFSCIKCYGRIRDFNLGFNWISMGNDPKALSTSPGEI